MPYFLIIPSLLAFACFICGVLFIKHLPKSLFALVMEAMASFTTDYLCYYMPQREDEIHNVFLFVDTSLLLWASYSIFPKRGRVPTLVTSFIAFVLTYTYLIGKEGIEHFANYALVTSSLCIIFIYLIIAYANEFVSNTTYQRPIRIISLALILYHTGTFAIFCGFHFFMTNVSYKRIVDINTTLDSLKYLLIAIAFYLFRKKSVKAAAV